MRSKSESQPPHAWSSHQSQSGVPCNCEDEVISNIMRGHPLSEAESHRVALNRIRPRMHVDPRDNHHRPVYVPLFQQLAPVPPSAFPEVKKRILMTGGGGQPRHSAERARQKASQPWDVEVKPNMSQRQTRKPAQNHCTMAHKDSRAKSMLSACDWNSVPHRPHMRQARPPPCAGSSLSVEPCLRTSNPWPTYLHQSTGWIDQSAMVGVKQEVNTAPAAAEVSTVRIAVPFQWPVLRQTLLTGLCLCRRPKNLVLGVVGVLVL